MRKKYTVVFLLLLITKLQAQHKVETILQQEYEKGHFNGVVLIVEQGKKVVEVQKGYANFQFQVPVSQKTRFPIASVTKLFTTIAILQLQENELLRLNDSIGKYISGLNDSCKNIKLADLLLHSSGLANEPIAAYTSKYKLDDYINTFVKPSTKKKEQFNYNNVDYILLSKVIENVTGLTYANAIDSLILRPLQMKNTGFVEDGEVIEQLAYGYHNYTFGSGNKNDKLYNDKRYLSNYYGAGQIYSTADDLSIFLSAIKNNLLVSETTKLKSITAPQTSYFVDWLQGKPTYGFFYNDTIPQRKRLYRSGNIDGFNSEIIVSHDFSKWIIILCNTDTGDLKEIGDKLVFELNH